MAPVRTTVPVLIRSMATCASVQLVIQTCSARQVRTFRKVTGNPAVVHCLRREFGFDYSESKVKILLIKSYSSQVFYCRPANVCLKMNVNVISFLAWLYTIVSDSCVSV